MKILIIGLGIYGSNLAKDLTDIGHEVIGSDVKPSLVEAVKDYISTAYIADATDEAALNALPILGVD
ncbi:MAG: NAD-binding protein, partial [Muribaculaceae bacterium]|nr:NAD-binding protein [Muribaculaceae bacterium]